MNTLICAIHIGSYRILAIAAQKDMQTGTLSNIQIESEPSRDCVAMGCITNVEQAAMHIRSLVQKLGNRMRTPIAAAYVGMGGMSLHSLVQQPSVQIPDYDVLDSVPLENGQFQLVVGQKRILQRIKTAMERANVRFLGHIVLPKATAEILTDDERKRGCVLVDMGAATTTVAIYHQAYLRHLAVIPMGGDNVTYDLQSTGCSFEDAERMKLDWSDVSQETTTENSAANSTTNSMFAEQALPISLAKLNVIALCRYEELAANIQHQIELSGVAEQLEACIITGGAVQQRGLTTLLSRRLSISRIETRALREVTMLGSERKPHLTNALGLLRFCSQSCAATATPSTSTTSAATTPAAAQNAATMTATPKSNDGQLDLEIPEDTDTEAESSSITQGLKRFMRDLFTGQD